MKQLDDNIGDVFAKLRPWVRLDNTIIVFTTDNGAETMTFPDGGITPFKGQKGNSWEGGYRVADADPLAGAHQGGRRYQRDHRRARLGADVTSSWPEARRAMA